MFSDRLGAPVLPNAKSLAQIVQFGRGSRHRIDDRNAIGQLGLAQQPRSDEIGRKELPN
jgi:hypothetical protein